ncbi:hypothetical protein CJP74_06700 [Psittacicella melopsittaci]|uniref:RNA polymerase sigma factor n=1 Tax=Psittacicella melopsittaci TaxID=2028576 RepID=A0A3A1Y297_9GAMM|nr:sigma-70 family RNA polymerase sigma factor [Psittacicella melopsittaci]RIY31685.1 hypothetical protein CJP74_06700 [Psittacicella melopsittaci]
MSERSLKQIDNNDEDLRQQELKLIERIKSGDMNAFGILVTRYQNRLIQFLLKKYGDNGLVEDVAQNVFVLAYRKLDSFQGKSRFYTWLCTIAIRQMLNAISARDRRVSLTFESDMGYEGSYVDLQEDKSNSIEDNIIADENRRVLQELLNQIPEHILRPFLMRIQKGMSYKDISAELNLTIDSVRSRINRARIMYKELIEENGILSKL